MKRLRRIEFMSKSMRIVENGVLLLKKVPWTIKKEILYSKVTQAHVDNVTAIAAVHITLKNNGVTDRTLKSRMIPMQLSKQAINKQF